ncbi:hypothetical protein [Streptomyces xanthii]|nr:hypothetical protein [Streptomyces xanthii]
MAVQQAAAEWAFTLRPDPALLFRFSALTYTRRTTGSLGAR